MWRNILMVALVGWLAGSTSVNGADPFPPLVFPEGMGVNIHFTTGHDRDLDLINAAGFRVVRMDFGWGGIERKQGEYDWNAYDGLTDALEKRGIRPMYILDYSNGLYEETVTSHNPLDGRERRDVASPSRPESVAAFARWAAAAAQRYRGRHVIWEIWNEPNISFWKPKPDVAQYSRLAQATCDAVRAADPEAIIVAPATSQFPWEFLDAFFATGILEHLDGVSVHPYREYRLPPETASADYKRLRELIGRHAPVAKREMPILSGEWGYASHRKGLSDLRQAEFLARQQLMNVFYEVPVSIWYDWKNDGEDAEEREHNFGTVDHRLEPKPAYVAAQTLARELGGFRIDRRLELSGADDYALLLINDDQNRKLAAWTLKDAHRTTIELSFAVTAAQAVLGNGERGNVRLEGTALTVELSGLPTYIRLDSEK